MFLVLCAARARSTSSNTQASSVLPSWFFLPIISVTQEAGKFDALLRKAFNSTNVGQVFLDFFASSEGQQWATKAALPAAAFAVMLVFALLIAPFLFCCRCNNICCFEASRGNACKCLGPDNCCVPGRHADEFTCCSPCGGKLVPLVLWFIFAILTLAFAIQSILSSGTAANGVSKSVCGFSELPAHLSNYTSAITGSVDKVETSVNNVITVAEGAVAKGEAISPKLTDLNTKIQNLVCSPAPNSWDVSQCSEIDTTAVAPNLPKLYACPTASFPTACNAGPVSSVCCVQLKDTVGLVTAAQVTAITAANTAANPTKLTIIPQQTKDAAESGGSLNKVPADTKVTVDKAKSDIDTFATKTKADLVNEKGTINNNLNSANATMTQLKQFQGDLETGVCDVRAEIYKDQQYTYVAGAVPYVFFFITLVFGIAAVIGMLTCCKPDSSSDAGYPRYTRCFHAMQCSWVCSLGTMLFLGLGGIVFYVLALALGDSCYTLENMPKVGFNTYIGPLMPQSTTSSIGGGSGPAGLQQPGKILDACYNSDANIMKAIGLELPNDIETKLQSALGSVSTLQMGDLAGDTWLTNYQNIQDANVATLTAAATGVDALIKEISADGAAIQTDVNNIDLKTITSSLKGIEDSVNACGWMRTVYDGTITGLCNEGLEGLLWVTLSSALVGWFSFPLIILSIVINVRMSGIGQFGYWKRSGGIGSSSGTSTAAVNPSTDGQGFEMPAAKGGSDGNQYNI